PPSYYSELINKGIFTVQTILAFSDKIKRDPGIVVGRLQNEGLVDYSDSKLQAMKHLYKVKVIRS
ncbi:MAG TPA: addiction module antidote protein, HigA family, partial [Ruminococcaceae bacterium]|nr:addiction module antidote protein, HigA family [Oscillospiraceae bacterium]